jgi:tetratricopeptide (TPR) repeat protein
MPAFKSIRGNSIVEAFRSCKVHGLCLLIGLWLVLAPGLGQTKPPDKIENDARALQAEWAAVFYEAPRQEHAPKYKALLTRVRELKAQHPNRAEPLIVEAIILCTYSAAALGLDTLDMLEQARTLLEKAIDIDPPALDGAAFVTLGNLYRRLPGWPILYGDKQLARQYFENGLKLYPDAIDTNYFYGDYLLDQGDIAGARRYLEKASLAPIRPSLRVSDVQLKQETNQALADARNGNRSRSDFFSLFTPSFDKK